MSLASSFGELLPDLAAMLTARSFSSFVMLLTGSVFARRRTITRMIQAADATARGWWAAWRESTRRPRGRRPSWRSSP